MITMINKKFKSLLTRCGTVLHYFSLDALYGIKQTKPKRNDTYQGMQ